MKATRFYAREGERLYLRGDMEASLGLLTEGARTYPEDVTGRLVLARVYREGGHEQQARGWLESALRLDPACPVARLQLAEMLGGVEADNHFGQLRAQEPWDKGYLAPVTVISAPVAVPPTELSPPAEFEFEDENAEPEIDLDSLPHVATVTLAEIYLQQGLTEQAAQIFRQLLEREPGDASVKKRLEEIESSTSEARPETGGATGGIG
jgi:tetratricopeptide (TPR) repeat protein